MCVCVCLCVCICIGVCVCVCVVYVHLCVCVYVCVCVCVVYARVCAWISLCRPSLSLMWRPALSVHMTTWRFTTAVTGGRPVLDASAAPKNTHPSSPPTPRSLRRSLSTALF